MIQVHEHMNPYALAMKTEATRKGLLSSDFLFRVNHAPDGTVEVVKNEARPIQTFSNASQTLVNDYKATIDTLTGLLPGVIRRQFYQINDLASIVPISVSNVFAFKDEVIKYRALGALGDLKLKLTSSSLTPNVKIPKSDIEFKTEKFPLAFYADSVSYSVFEQLRANANLVQLNVVEEKEILRKTNWDLAVQEVMFLGDATIGLPGLLTNSSVTADTTTLTKALHALTDAEFIAFVSTFVRKYLENSQNIFRPDRFLISQLDYVQLSSAVLNTANASNITRLEYLNRAMDAASGTETKILPIIYCNQNRNNLSKNRYVLYKFDVNTLEMHIPVNYTSGMFQSADNFSFQSVAYGQLSGTQIYNAQNVYYFDFTATI